MAGGGEFLTQADCEAALAHKLAWVDRMIANQPTGHVFMSKVPNGYQHKMGPKHTRTETWRCLLETESPPS